MTKKRKDMVILVADDMTNMRRTIKGMLRQMGYEKIVEAANGEDALRIVKSTKIDFIVTDWNMPKMTGIELLKAVREDIDNKNMPILMITAEITETQIAHAAETVVDGYIIKPFVFNVFKEKLDEVLKKYAEPHPIDVVLSHGTMLIEDGRAENAIMEYAKVLQKYPKSAKLMVATAEALEKTEDTTRAIDFYKRAATVNPLFVKAHEGLANLLEKTGDKEAALLALEKAAKISPNNPERQNSMGKKYLENGDKIKAKVAFNAALKNAGSDPKIAAEIGESFLAAGMADLAAEAFKHSLASDPQNITIYNRLGIALRRKGRFREAIAEYKKALRISPKDEVLYYNLAKVYSDSKQFNDALINIKLAIQIDPEFEEAIKLKEEFEKVTGG